LVPNQPDEGMRPCLLQNAEHFLVFLMVVYADKRTEFLVRTAGHMKTKRRGYNLFVKYFICEITPETGIDKDLREHSSGVENKKRNNWRK
jgi:hypothetical protein